MMGRAVVDMIGRRFGRWVVVARSANEPGKEARWCVVCDCGQSGVRAGSHLRNGGTTSCGCLRNEKARTQQTIHGQSVVKTGAYRSWVAMCGRCFVKSNGAFDDYGGAGITVCDRWRGERGFENFYEDMGDRPEGMSLDRYPDRGGNYEPTNCRWATPKQQARNLTTNRRITAFGETRIMIEWAEAYGLRADTLKLRLRRMTPEEALTAPLRGNT